MSSTPLLQTWASRSMSTAGRWPLHQPLHSVSSEGSHFSLWTKKKRDEICTRDYGMVSQGTFDSDIRRRSTLRSSNCAILSRSVNIYIGAFVPLRRPRKHTWHCSTIPNYSKKKTLKLLQQILARAIVPFSNTHLEFLNTSKERRN